MISRRDLEARTCFPAGAGYGVNVSIFEDFVAARFADHNDGIPHTTHAH